ncbi:MAG: TetR/AcrR family transcriptional regulator [bacterium]|nr:TetR/AcrR family transcriptional regulator [bacterium]
MSSTLKIDRAALVRRALIELVADNGFRGTSMTAVADRAGVATGTAYVHYASKDDLVLAAYLEVKTDLGAAGIAAVDTATQPERRFRDLWLGIYEHLAADPSRARFLIQVEASPYAKQAHEAAMVDDEMFATPALQDVVESLVDLPLTVLWGMAAGPAIRLAASDEAALSRAALELVARGCWRSVTAE